jgi:hypothetical protein
MSETKSIQDLAKKRKNKFRELVSENTIYPLATITYRGPNPEQASKIIVGILSSKDQAPIIREWSGEGIAEDAESAREIALFIQENDVSRVLTSEWVLSCPHDEGIDYPEGEQCPFCPDWHST